MCCSDLFCSALTNKEHYQKVKAFETESADLCLRTKMWLCHAVTPESCRLVYSMKRDFNVEVKMLFNSNVEARDSPMKRQLWLKGNITGKPLELTLITYPHFPPDPTT